MYQGERLVADRNKFIGKFVVEHIPPAPAGLKLAVALALDDDGILSVQAKLAGSIQWQVRSHTVSSLGFGRNHVTTTCFPI